jgi:hypothetical protein
MFRWSSGKDEGKNDVDGSKHAATVVSLESVWLVQYSHVNSRIRSSWTRLVIQDGAFDQVRPWE